MRTNIEIDDDLMAAAMAAGGFKTKKEAVEEGLRLLKRKQAYAALLAARGTLFWDDSDEAWAKAREERQLAETVAVYQVKPAVKGRKSRAAAATRRPAKGKSA
jgi:antitoxin ParD1/3/4